MENDAKPSEAPIEATLAKFTAGVREDRPQSVREPLRASVVAFKRSCLPDAIDAPALGLRSALEIQRCSCAMSNYMLRYQGENGSMEKTNDELASALFLIAREAYVKVGKQMGGGHASTWFFNGETGTRRETCSEKKQGPAKHII